MVAAQVQRDATAHAPRLQGVRRTVDYGAAERGEVRDVRALTPIEFAALHDMSLPGELPELSGARDPIEDIYDRLVKRRCMTRVVTVGYINWDITPLGRLALRVSRPDAAIKIP
jgi:hypothetical protein